MWSAQGGIVGFDDIIYQENIDIYPDFTNNEEEDYHLQITSLCIDSGNPNSPNDPDGTIADMGAYYFNQNEYIPGCMDQSAQNYNLDKVLKGFGPIPGSKVGLIWDVFPIDLTFSLFT